jgi:hypothetical protein
MEVTHRRFGLALPLGVIVSRTVQLFVHSSSKSTKSWQNKKAFGAERLLPPAVPLYPVWPPPPSSFNSISTAVSHHWGQPPSSSMSNGNNFSLTIQTLSWAVADNNLLIGNAVVHPHRAAHPSCGSATTSLCCPSSPPPTTPNPSPTPVNPRLRHGMGARTGVACSCNGATGVWKLFRN